jgi:hypothetical protein
MPRDGRIYIWSNGLKIAEVIALADFDFDNAKLITAAPDLLEALKVASRLLFLYLPTDEGYGIPAAKERIHAAITKATGGAE